MNRRNFLKASIAGSALTASLVSPALLARDTKQLRLASSWQKISQVSEQV